jgi:hypothetical protein
MPLYRMVPSLVVLAGSMISWQNTAIAQEYRGSMEQQMACTPDVFRLCGSQIPDVNRIVGCLRQNATQLSGPCRAVFDSNASVPQPSQRAAPGRRQYPAGDDE